MARRLPTSTRNSSAKIAPHSRGRRRLNPDDPALRIVMKTQPAARGHSAVYLDGFLGPKRVAEMAIEELDRRGGMWTDFLRGSCGTGYRAACEVEGTELRVFVVTFSSVMPAAQNAGHGVELYAAAVAWADAHHGVLAPTRCVYGEGTSDAAERVWRSRRFASVVRLFGNVAVGLR